MAMTAAALGLLISLLTCVELTYLDALELDHADAGRLKRENEIEYCCHIPFNETMRQMLLGCGLLNGNNGTDPLDLVGTHVMNVAAPQFNEAICDNNEDCNNKTLGCEFHCLFNHTGVLDNEGVPIEAKALQLITEMVNTDLMFKELVKKATKKCFSKMKRKLRKNKDKSKVNICKLVFIVNDCIEYEITKKCPTSYRSAYNTERSECAVLTQQA